MLIRFASLLLLATLAGCATKAPIAVVEDLSPTAQPLAEGLKACLLYTSDAADE